MKDKNLNHSPNIYDVSAFEMDTDNSEIGLSDHERTVIRAHIQIRDEEKKIKDSANTATTTTFTQIVKSLNCDEVISIGGRTRAIGIICPECVCTGLNSRVHIGSGMRTHAGIETYYDEKGQRHSHDRNVSRADWSCTQGHAGSYRSVKGCPAPDCQKSGYTVLCTDPYNFKEARSERNRIEDEERKRAREAAEAERIARGDPLPPPLNTNIGSFGGDLIGTYPVSSITVGPDGRVTGATSVPTYYTNTMPGIYYTSTAAGVHVGTTATATTVPATAATATATATATTVPATATAVDAPTDPVGSLQTPPDSIRMEVTYGDRTYVGVLTIKPTEKPAEDKK